MSLRLNVHITKIMRTLTKVGVHTYATYANCRTLNKLYKTLGYGSRDMLKSDFFRKRLGMVSPPHFVYEFS